MKTFQNFEEIPKPDWTKKILRIGHNLFFIGKTEDEIENWIEINGEWKKDES